MVPERLASSSKPEQQDASARSSHTLARKTSVAQQISHQSTATSGGLPIFYQSRSGTASIESTLDALRLSAEAEPDSSIEFILTPPRHPRHSEPLARSTPVCLADAARPRSVSAEVPSRTQKAAKTTPKKLIKASDLNPEVAPFRARDELAPVSARSLLARFHEIVKEGKDLIGELRLDAKAALADLGLKPIPSLHGSAQLPYARNPSGIDSFHFSVEEDEEAFTPTVDACGVRARPGPLPLPGNARYTDAGRLVQQRISSAPAALGGFGTSTVCPSQSTSAAIPSPPRRASPRWRKQVPLSASAFDDVAAIAVEPFMTISVPTKTAAPLPMDEQTITQAAVAAQQRQMAQQAQQAHFARQAQLMLLAAQAPQSPSSHPAGLAYAPPYASIAPGTTFPSARPTQDQKNMPAISPSLAGLTSHPFSPPPAESVRRQSIVISPDGHIDVVDSLAVLALTHQQRHATRSKQSAASLAPSSELDLAAPSSVACVHIADHAASAVQPTPFSTDPPHAPAPPHAGRNASHKRSDSDTGLTKKVYLEKGRRQSTAPHFPSRRAARKESLPPAIRVLPVAPNDGLEAAGTAKVPEKSVDQIEPRRAFADIANRLPIVHEPLAEGSCADAPASHGTILPTSKASSVTKSKGKKSSSRKKPESPAVAPSAGSVRSQQRVLQTAQAPAVDDPPGEKGNAILPGDVIHASKGSGKGRANARRRKALSTASTSEAT